MCIITKIYLQEAVEIYQECKNRLCNLTPSLPLSSPLQQHINFYETVHRKLATFVQSHITLIRLLMLFRRHTFQVVANYLYLTNSYNFQPLDKDYEWEGLASQNMSYDV